MNIPIKKQLIMTKKVRFSDTSILVLLPNPNIKCAGAGWYSQDDIESFKALFVLSVAKVRMKLSRGGIDAIVATEILGMEKRLTRHLSKEYATRRKKLMKSVTEEQKWQQVASDQSKWAFERARAAALFLEDTMDSGR